MSNTTKRFSEFDANQTLTGSYNDINATIGVDGFIVGKVGRGFELEAVSPTVDNLHFYEDLGDTLLYTLEITYDNADHDNVIAAYRTA
jgi:hypothetical protein